MERSISKKIIVMLCCFALAFVAAGCGSSKTSTAKKTTSSKSKLEAIGTVQSGKYVYKINTTNETGRTITGFAIKGSSSDNYSSNMLKKNSPFKNGDKRCLYYNAKKDILKSSGQSSTDGSELNADFYIQLTFDDNSTIELHHVPFDDIKSMELHYDSNQSLAYLNYVSKGTKKQVNTLNDEVQVKQEAEAASQASQASSTQKSTASTTTTSSSSGTAARTTQSSSAARTTTQRSTAARTTTQRTTSTPRTTTRTTPRTTTPARSSGSNSSSSGSSGTSSGGCIGDGEMY
jgi:hypothetical protein